ncbi:MAG TPA: tetratricopeptide repeat protein [Streptosporangiaceae bacterium]|jgi:Tfp pilus assembly protein PilF
MTVEELLRRGGEFQAAGDFKGAEEAYKQADELHDAEGAIRFGTLLKRRGELAGAADAFQRAYERTVRTGSSDALLNLGLVLRQEGDTNQALPYLLSAEEKGSPEASRAIGEILEDRGDLKSAEVAYRRAAAAGHAKAAFAHGAVLVKLNDTEAARVAFRRAHNLGNDDARKILEFMDQQATKDQATTWAKLYIAACQAVITATDACLELANQAVRARNLTTKHPQLERSIQTFTRSAEQSEEEFIAAYRVFVSACDNARDIAAKFLAAQTGHDPEAVLMLNVEGDTLGNVATAKSILRTRFGYMPADFVEGMREVNILMQNPFPEEGNIYKPSPPDERTCPWCAETIKAAAIICRFCNRDVRIQPGVPEASS